MPIGTSAQGFVLAGEPLAERAHSESYRRATTPRLGATSARQSLENLMSCFEARLGHPLLRLAGPLRPLDYKKACCGPSRSAAIPFIGRWFCRRSLRRIETRQHSLSHSTLFFCFWIAARSAQTSDSAHQVELSIPYLFL